MLLAHRNTSAIVKEEGEEDVIESPDSLSPIESPVRGTAAAAREQRIGKAEIKPGKASANNPEQTR